MNKLYHLVRNSPNSRKISGTLRVAFDYNAMKTSVTAKPFEENMVTFCSMFNAS